MGRFLRGAILGLLVALTTGVWPAGAQATVAINSPAPGDTLAGNVAVQFEAHSTCGGFTGVTLKISGAYYAGKTPALSYVPPGADYSDEYPWDTKQITPRNGTYTVQFDAHEESGDTLNPCTAHDAFKKITVTVENAPVAPVWPTKGATTADYEADGPIVTLKWPKNPEVDIRAYRITRTGPGGPLEATVAATTSTYQYHSDYAFTPDSYDGAYDYSVVALRGTQQRLTANGEWCDDANPCLASASSNSRSITLKKPPTPTPKPRPTPTVQPGGGGAGPGSTPVPSPSVLGNRVRGGGDGAEFFQGSFERRLPYQARTLLIPGARSTIGGSGNEQALGSDGFVGSPAPNHRTVVLPVAGGLLTFLAAAHVRRLLSE